MGDLMAGTCGPCRKVHGRPLFVYMRSTVNCKGSKIEHLLNEGRISIKSWRVFDTFISVIKRLLRDRPMPASEFQQAINSTVRRYGMQPRSFLFGGLFDFYSCGSQIIGDVRLINGEIIYIRNNEVAAMRDIEFKKPKYKKMEPQQVDFLRSLFELSEYSKQLARGKK